MHVWILVQSYLQLDLVLAVYKKKASKATARCVHALAVWPLAKSLFLAVAKGLQEERKQHHDGMGQL